MVSYFLYTQEFVTSVVTNIKLSNINQYWEKTRCMNLSVPLVVANKIMSGFPRGRLCWKLPQPGCFDDFEYHCSQWLAHVLLLSQIQCLVTTNIVKQNKSGSSKSHDIYQLLQHCSSSGFVFMTWTNSKFLKHLLTVDTHSFCAFSLQKSTPFHLKTSKTILIFNLRLP